MRGSLTGGLAGPLTVVAARARRTRTWILPTIALAVVFGFAQQIVTGAVDRRANTLAKETPSVKGV